jgi:23S rRNA pseudouridine2604 synthase
MNRARTRPDVGGSSVKRPSGEPTTDPSHLPSGMRLSKLMAERGLCSRREADALIERGWVRVDGQTVSVLGIRVSADAHIELTPQAQKAQGHRLTVLLNKPIGYVSAQPEDGYPAAIECLTPENRFENDPGKAPGPQGWRGLAPAGRLDIDSTGLLVLTQDGRIARTLIGEDSLIDKEYLVRVRGTLSANGLALLRHGLSLDGVPLKPANVEWQNEDQLRFCLREGKKRQIRRMCEAVGLEVTGLKRVRIGKVRLGNLPLGQWRLLSPDETF